MIINHLSPAALAYSKRMAICPPNLTKEKNLLQNEMDYVPFWNENDVLHDQQGPDTCEYTQCPEKSDCPPKQHTQPPGCGGNTKQAECTAAQYCSETNGQFHQVDFSKLDFSQSTKFTVFEAVI